MSVHLLGYLFDPEHEAIVAEQARLRTERRHRLHRIAEKMAADGYPVDPDGLLALLPDGTSAGRPHLARALVTAGVVESVDEAFGTLLYNGSPYYVPKADTPVRHRDPDGAGGRRGAGVRAPAGPPPRPGGGALGDRRAGRGRAGRRRGRPSRPQPEPTATCCAAWPRDLGLLATGSSDYHGTNKTTPLAAESTTEATLDALLAQATGAPLLPP